jgi:hypothetical protein
MLRFNGGNTIEKIDLREEFTDARRAHHGANHRACMGAGVLQVGILTGMPSMVYYLRGKGIRTI